MPKITYRATRSMFFVVVIFNEDVVCDSLTCDAQGVYNKQDNILYKRNGSTSFHTNDD